MVATGPFSASAEDDGGQGGHVTDITLDRQERLDLLDAVANAYRGEAAATIVLNQIGFPRARRPSWQGLNPEQWWGMVFEEFDNGIIPAPYRRLLAAAARRFPGNQFFQRLASRHGVAPGGSGPWAQPPAATTSRSKIFLCHAVEDKERVRGLHQRLLADGLTPWLDEEDIGAGEEWDPAIRRAIRASRFLLACLSAVSASKVGFVQKEIRLALDIADEQPEGTIFLIPVRLEDCAVPDRLSRWQRVDLFKPTGYQRLLTTLRNP
jgi:TIR domain/Effector-associated domain 1